MSQNALDLCSYSYFLRKSFRKDFTLNASHCIIEGLILTQAMKKLQKFNSSVTILNPYKLIYAKPSLIKNCPRFYMQKWILKKRNFRAVKFKFWSPNSLLPICSRNFSGLWRVCFISVNVCQNYFIQSLDSRRIISLEISWNKM